MLLIDNQNFVNVVKNTFISFFIIQYLKNQFIDSFIELQEYQFGFYKLSWIMEMLKDECLK